MILRILRAITRFLTSWYQNDRPRVPATGTRERSTPIRSNTSAQVACCASRPSSRDLRRRCSPHSVVPRIAKTGWLRTLDASSRNSRRWRSVVFQLFSSAASSVLTTGPRSPRYRGAVPRTSMRRLREGSHVEVVVQPVVDRPRSRRDRPSGSAAACHSRCCRRTALTCSGRPDCSVKNPLEFPAADNAIHDAIHSDAEMPSRGRTESASRRWRRSGAARRCCESERSSLRFSGSWKLVVPPSHVRLPEVIETSSIIFDQV